MLSKTKLDDAFTAVSFSINGFLVLHRPDRNDKDCGNYIHKGALCIVYRDLLTSFEGLLAKDKSATIHKQNFHRLA